MPKRKKVGNVEEKRKMPKRENVGNKGEKREMPQRKNVVDEGEKREMPQRKRDGRRVGGGGGGVLRCFVSWLCVAIWLFAGVKGAWVR